MISALRRRLLRSSPLASAASVFSVGALTTFAAAHFLHKTQNVVSDAATPVIGLVISLLLGALVWALLAAQQAEERAEFLQVLLDAMEVGVISCDASGKPLFLNGMARRLLNIDGPIGTPPEDWGKRHGFLHAETLEPLTVQQHPLLRALSAEVVENEELVLRSATGQERLFAVNARALRRADGTLLGAVAVGHDVTRLRDEMEAKSSLLREVEQQRSLYSDLLTGISELGEGVIIAEGERLVFINRAMSKMSGYTEEELLALPSHLVLIRPEERTGWAARMAEIESGVGPNEPREQMMVTKSGEEIPVEIASKVLRTGDRVQRLGVIRDIRARRQIEDAVAAHAEALLAANQELVELESMRSDFLAAVSHDFRTPLTSIIGFVEVTLDREDTTPLGDVRMFLDRASRAAAELNIRVGSFLEFSRSMRVGVDLQLAPAQLSDMIEEVLAQMAPVLECNPMHIDLAEACVAIEERAFTRVIENLLTNAIKYSPEGSAVAVHSYVQDGEAFLVVEDRGSGIAPENLHRIFESYFRSDDVRSSVKGSGVGLAVVRQLVEGMNGRVWAMNRAGGGSAFYVALPLISSSVQ